MSFDDNLDKMREHITVNSPNPVWEVTFYQKAVPATPMQIANGSPSFINKDYIRMMPRAEQLPCTIYDREVDFFGISGDTFALSRRLPDPERFPYEWRIYKEGLSDEAHGGIPLNAVRFLSAADVEYYKSKKINNVEQLANLSAAAVRDIGGGAEKHSIKAREFLSKDQENTAQIIELTSSHQKLLDELNALKTQLAVSQNDGEGDFIKTRRKPKQEVENALS